MVLDTTGGVIQTTKAVLHDGSSGMFLLVKEPDGTWGLPGGAKEVEDADILEALRRELFEELSLAPDEYAVFDPKISDEFLYGQQGSERFGMKGFNNFFIVEVKSINGIRKEKKLLDIAWFEAEEALQKLEHASMRRGFDRAIKILKKDK